MMIERYAKKRSERLFRANDGEYVQLQDSARGHFPVYMHACGSSPDVVTLRAHWSARCAHTKRIHLRECVNRFNDRNPWLTVSVREAHDSSALTVVVNSSILLADEVDFGVFVRFVDLSLASAAKLFEQVYPGTQLPSPAELRRCLQLPA